MSDKKRNRDYTREALLKRLRELKIAREAFQDATWEMTSDNPVFQRRRDFNRGFDWAINKIKGIA